MSVIKQVFVTKQVFSSCIALSACLTISFHVLQKHHFLFPLVTIDWLKVLRQLSTQLQTLPLSQPFCLAQCADLSHDMGQQSQVRSYLRQIFCTCEHLVLVQSNNSFIPQHFACVNKLFDDWNRTCPEQQFGMKHKNLTPLNLSGIAVWHEAQKVSKFTR